MPKKFVLRLIILIWLIFSAVYIGWDVWSDFMTQKIAQAYQAGKTDTIDALISQAEAGCQPFSVFSGDKQIQLINVSCLQQSGTEQ